MKPCAAAAVAALLAFGPATGLSAEHIDVRKAARVKAAYLYHLARLTEWPPEVLPAPDDTLLIGVVGEDPNDLSGYFGSRTRDFRAGRHPIEIHHLRDGACLLDGSAAARDSLCRFHMLFFTESETDRCADYLGLIGTHPVLTTSEIDAFSGAGGMVGFFVADRQVRIDVNPRAVARAALRISAEFLQHANLVDTTAGSGDGD